MGGPYHGQRVSGSPASGDGSGLPVSGIHHGYFPAPRGTRTDRRIFRMERLRCEKFGLHFPGGKDQGASSERIGRAHPGGSTPAAGRDRARRGLADPRRSDVRGRRRRPQVCAACLRGQRMHVGRRHAVLRRAGPDVQLHGRLVPGLERSVRVPGRRRVLVRDGQLRRGRRSLRRHHHAHRSRFPRGPEEQVPDAQLRSPRHRRGAQPSLRVLPRHDDDHGERADDHTRGQDQVRVAQLQELRCAASQLERLRRRRDRGRDRPGGPLRAARSHRRHLQLLRRVERRRPVHPGPHDRGDRDDTNSGGRGSSEVDRYGTYSCRSGASGKLTLVASDAMDLSGGRSTTSPATGPRPPPRRPTSAAACSR